MVKLSFFGLNHERLSEKKYLISVLFLIMISLLLSVKFAFSLDNTSDFAVFWHAGNNFSQQNDLYSNIGGADRFIYPPFAAFCFQIFAILPMQWAGFAWCLLNFGLCAAVIKVVYDIFSFFYDDEKKLKIAIGIAFLLSIRYFIYHQMYAQMNILMLFLCLLGVKQIILKKENIALLLLIFACFIKILPIFFLVWVVINGNLKTWIKAILIVLPFLLIPILQRGFEIGVQDHLKYYEVFLEPFQQGRIEPKLNNYSLSALIAKWNLPLTLPSGNTVHIFNNTYEKVQSIYKVCFVFLFSFYFFMIFYDRKKNNSKTYTVVVPIIFCLMHLLSGISWEYHFVSLLYVLVPLVLLIQRKNNSSFLKTTLYFILFLSFIIGIEGQDTVGKTLHFCFNHFCAISILTLTLLFFNIYLFFKKSL